MTRFNLLLLVALLLSSLYLVRVAYDSRRLFTELDRAQAEERTLATDHERLKTERQSQATPLLVERTARDKLGMRSATPAITQYVNPPPATSQAGSAAAPAASASGSPR